MVMPTTMIPSAKGWDELSKYDAQDHRLSQLVIEATDQEETENGVVQDWQESVNGALSFEEIRQIIRDRDRLIVLNAENRHSP